MPCGTVNYSGLILALALCLAPAASLAGSLFDHAWTPRIGDASEPPSPQIFLRLDAEGGVSGNGGCNGFMGRFVTNAEAILFSPLAATSMYCDEPVMAAEHAFLAAIEAARQFGLEHGVLELRDADGVLLVRLVPLDDK